MLNKVLLQGRLTADPELKTTSQGVSVTAFSIAVDRDYQSNGERQTDFINIVAWRGTAEFICRNFRKGKMIIVSGNLQVRNYTAQDNTKRYVTEVIAENVYFAGDKAQTAENANFGANTEDFTEIGNDDTLPF